jgi:hypothetical protein
MVWFGFWCLMPQGNLISSTNKTERHNVYETLLKVALNTKNQTKPFSRGKRKI